MMHASKSPYSSLLLMVAALGLSACSAGLPEVGPIDIPRLEQLQAECQAVCSELSKMTMSYDMSEALRAAALEELAAFRSAGGVR
jgi:hypothetical protein